MATNLGLELARLGHQVHFISYEQPFRLTSAFTEASADDPLLKFKKLGVKNVFFHKVDINEYDLFKYPDYTLPLAVKIEEVQKKFKLDVVHVHYAVPHATAALLARRIMRSNGTPLPKIVTTLHGTDITLLARDKNLFDVIKYSIERSHGVTAVSQDLKKDTVKLLKTAKPIEVIYNFYTPPPVTKTKAAIRKSLKLRDSDFVAIHLSNLRPVKRIPDLLKIASKIHHPNFKLLILGGDFTPFEALAKKLKLGTKLIVKQSVQDIGNYLNAADLGIYTSETESFGMAMLETMSYGKPVLATNSGGVPEVLDNGKTGFLLKIGDINGFVKKAELLMLDNNLREQMGELAKKIACEKFCAHKIVPQYVEYYCKVMNE